MSAIELLCEIIAQGGEAAVATYRQRTGFEAILRCGYVRESDVVQSMVCLECDLPHDAEIIYERGKYGYYCPELGLVPVERSDITALQPDFTAIVSGLADAFGCKNRKSTPLQGATWRIGTAAQAGGVVSLYLHPSLQDGQAVTDLMAALSREIRSTYRLVLTAEGTLAVPNSKTAQLMEVVEIGSDPTAFTLIADPFDIVDAPRKNPGGAPNRNKRILAPLILERMQNGSALTGRNEEAKAILDVLRGRNTDTRQPSLSSIKDYLTKCRVDKNWTKT